jgi:uncharacterized protein (DUF305 family)
MTRTRTLLAASAALVAALTLASCATTDAASVDTPSAPSPAAELKADASEFNEADIMFAQMMIPHHLQAVEMSDTLLAKTGISAETVALAEDIKAAQEPEIVQLNALLVAWGFDEMTAADDMAGMDHSSGMMSDEDTAALDSATGPDAERLYLEQMIEHHEGAIDMASPQVIDGENADAVELAESIESTQQKEISTMKKLLAAIPAAG